MRSIMTIEMAIAKLISSMSALVWLIPGLFLVELYVRYISGTLDSWTFSPFVDVLTSLIWMIIIFKIISVIDKHMEKNPEKKDKK